MQALAVYGRLLARAVVSGLNNELSFPQGSSTPWTSTTCSQCTLSRPLHLVTAASGLAKSQSQAQVRTKWAFGDDACFVAAQKLADVIGESPTGPTYMQICPPNDPY